MAIINAVYTLEHNGEDFINRDKVRIGYKQGESVQFVEGFLILTANWISVGDKYIKSMDVVSVEKVV